MPPCWPPLDSPNTDGIDPDSNSSVCIKDAHISTGDDSVAIKSGWDEYGIAYGCLSSGITIHRVIGSSPLSGIAIGSETSGGVENVLVEDINLYDANIVFHTMINIGRGDRIRNVTAKNVIMNRVRKEIAIVGAPTSTSTNETVRRSRTCRDQELVLYADMPLLKVLHL